MADNDFFIILKRNDDLVVNHTITAGDVDQDFVDSVFAPTESKESTESTEDEASEGVEVKESDKTASLSPYPDSFLSVERAFSQAMLMYRNSVIETIRVSPVLAKVTLARSIDGIVKTRGTKREDLSSGDIEVYSLPSHATYSINRHVEKSEALLEGAQHLPKISTIGIISSYDAILTDLLRVIFSVRPEIIFTSDREIKFSELMGLGSIEAARDSIISNEIEAVVRQSHHEQFSWMERKFGIKLREGLDVWPDFIELCERRNLLTHTGGIVSEQYLKNCEQYGKKSSHKVGDKLDVDLSYLRRATDIVSEVGYKLIHTMWRKFSPDDRGRADSILNQLGMNLIAAREYGLAEKMMEFAVGQKRHNSDLVKRMMVVNLANAAKLGGNKERCDRALSSHDWSATSYQFQICVAAVRNNFAEVRRLLEMGANVIEITSSDFRDWPVFRDARKDAGVQEAFERVFGEKLIRPIGADLPESITPSESASSDGEQTIH